jgi:predicted ribosomally synthesized peptide with SipW-like signal peptide
MEVRQAVRNKRFTSKTYLKVLLAVGVLAVIAGGAGTFASFTAQTENAGNTFATGTLQLSNSANSGTACLSYNGSSNTNAACSAIVTVATSPGAAPGSAIATGTVSVTNTGTLPASKFELFSPSASDCTDTQVTALGTLNPTTGNPLCAAVVMYVQETAQSGTGESGEGTYTYCWFGYSSDSNHTCNTTPGTLDTHNSNTITTFDTSDVSPGIELKPLSATGTLDSTHTNGELPAGATRTFQIGLYLPSGSSNALQALKSTFGVTWHIDQ